MLADQLASIALGFLFGAVISLAIFVSALVTQRFVQIGTIQDVLLRLGVFAAISLAAAELLGTFFSALVRSHLVAFWLSFVVGFLLPPWLVHLLLQGKSKNVG